MPTGIYTRTEETKKILSEAHKGQIAWNKGIPMTEKVKKILYLVNKGRHHSEETIKKRSLTNTGKKRTKETKIKISLSKKGKKFSELHIKNLSLSHKGKMLGKDNKNWKGGISKDYIKKLSERKWHIIRKQIYRRDNYTCQICGIQYKDKNNNGLHCHHIIPYRVSLNDRLKNLITLCASCHIKEEHKYYHKMKGQQEFNFF